MAPVCDVRSVPSRHDAAPQQRPSRPAGHLSSFQYLLKLQHKLRAMEPMTPLVRSFVGHFGEMGSRWGINRTVGQIYALIFVAPRALNADEIAEALEFSRSNVSMR